MTAMTENHVAIERARLRMLLLTKVAGNLVNEVIAGHRAPFDPQMLQAHSAAAEATEAFAVALDAADGVPHTPIYVVH
jgi:hypothetical protein